MATTTKRKPKTAAAAPSTPADNQKIQEAPPVPMIGRMTLDQYVVFNNQRIGESQSYWNGKEFGLKKAHEENQKYYHGQQIDEDDLDRALDNRIFSAVRSILPYVTSRITEPEISPSDGEARARKFAEDLEAALLKHARKQKVRMKMKFAVQDAMIVRRGWLKLRYDAATHNFCAVEFCPAESVIVSHKAKAYEEPPILRHVLDKTVDDLLLMFPDNETKIKEIFHIDGTTGMEEYYKSREINEDWSFMTVDGVLDLFVTWSFRNQPLGMIQDPNWRYDDTNFLDSHMIPFIPVTILSDGRTIIDKTSFVEQAKYSQDTVDERTRQISKNAGIGATGMPVVDSRAMADDQAQFITFDPEQVLELDVKSTGVDDINKAFTTWKADPLRPEVFQDKADAREAIDNAFGTSNLQRGQESDNKTLGQDVLLRDQTQGRQQEIIDAIDLSTERLYLLMSQMLLVYGSEEEIFKISGKNAEFDYVIMRSDSIDTEAEISVKGGSSLPIDRPQLRATAKQAAADKMIDPRSYWEIMDQPNAEKYASRLVKYGQDPTAIISDIAEEAFNRDADVDIETVIRGGSPPYRENLTPDYFDHLKRYAMSGCLDLENPNMAMEVKQALVQFINAQLARGVRMLGMAETQLPTPEDIQARNQEIAAGNEADAAAVAGAAKGMPPAGPAGKPGAGPAPAPQGPPPGPMGA
jgi:hypothetical protein